MPNTTSTVRVHAGGAQNKYQTAYSATVQAHVRCATLGSTMTMGSVSCVLRPCWGAASVRTGVPALIVNQCSPWWAETIVSCVPTISSDVPAVTWSTTAWSAVLASTCRLPPLAPNVLTLLAVLPVLMAPPALSAKSTATLTQAPVPNAISQWRDATLAARLTYVSRAWGDTGLSTTTSARPSA